MVSVKPAYRQRIINRASYQYDMHVKHYGKVDGSRTKFVNDALARSYLPGLREGELMGLPESRAGQAANFRRLACSQADVSSAPDRVLLIPWGDNRREDGHVQIVDQESAYAIVDHFNSRRVDLVIDREHQSQGGQWASPDGTSPAAGWVKSMEVVQNVGIFGKVDWTAWGRERINAREYRYLSPVCIVDTKTGKVLYLESIGLTNKPAIPAMQAIVNQISPTPSRTVLPPMPDRQRATIINSAASVYDTDKMLRKFCSLDNWIDEQLRDAGLSPLTNTEKLSLPATSGDACTSRMVNSQGSGLRSDRQAIINSASAEYDREIKTVGKLCDRSAWINGKLRDENLRPATQDELRQFPADWGQR